MVLYVVALEYEHTQCLYCQYQEPIIAYNVEQLRKYNASLPIF